MNLPQQLRAEIEAKVGRVHRVMPLGGGTIAQVARVDTPDAAWVVKWSEGPGAMSFEAERDGLDQLRASSNGALVVPQQAGQGANWLLLEWLPPASANAVHWARLGEGLAALHEGKGTGGFGWRRDNFIGSTPQTNAWEADWVAFFRDRRLCPQIERARRNGSWRPGWDGPADRLLRGLGNRLPSAPPAAPVHGDLWHGNALATTQGPALIDPAFYWGHREVDLAMTRLFGGFEEGFYEAYSAVWPVEPGFEERVWVYNLYHVINHLNVFGSPYAGLVQAHFDELDARSATTT